MKITSAIIASLFLVSCGGSSGSDESPASASQQVDNGSTTDMGTTTTPKDDAKPAVAQESESPTSSDKQDPEQESGQGTEQGSNQQDPPAQEQNENTLPFSGTWVTRTDAPGSSCTFSALDESVPRLSITNQKFQWDITDNKFIQKTETYVNQEDNYQCDGDPAMESYYTFDFSFIESESDESGTYYWIQVIDGGGSFEMNPLTSYMASALNEVSWSGFQDWAPNTKKPINRTLEEHVAFYIHNEVIFIKSGSSRDAVKSGIAEDVSDFQNYQNNYFGMKKKI